MPRFPLLDTDTSSEQAAALLQRTQAQLGRTPNLYRAMANAPAALDGYLQFREALVKGALSAMMREQIALLVAELNDCEYCVSAHVFRGQKIGIAAEELALNRQGRASDFKHNAALSLVCALVAHRGRVSEEQYQNCLSAGWREEEIGEIVAHVALNIFSNYFNHIAQPNLDFPRVEINYVE